MINRLLSASALLVSFAILCLGHGLQSVLLPARGAMFKDYPNLIDGAMMSAYYIGFIFGTFTGPLLIHRVGHIRVFAAGAACSSTIMLLHALIPQPLVWIGLRMLYGFSFIHLYNVMESWLNSIGDAQSRGKILSIYMIINFIAMSGGQLMFFLAPAAGFELFSVSAIMLSLALVPLVVGRSMQPADIRPPELFGVRKLFKVSPLGIVGALVVGLMGGAYWGMTAIFVLKMGFKQDAVAWFMAASLIGGLLAQWPLGSLSDRINRRYVIMLASALVVCSSWLLAVMALRSAPPATAFGVGLLIVTGAMFGTGFHPLYSLCIAHANDFIGNEYFVRASAGLQFMQAIGAVVGPLLAGILMYLGGYAMLFVYIGTLAGLLILFTLARLAENRPPLRKTLFHLLTRTGAAAFFMDPRYRRKWE